VVGGIVKKEADEQNGLKPFDELRVTGKRAG
jgi:hypothetical protein